MTLTTVTVTLPANDFGQILDGLRVRMESYDRTVRYFQGDLVAGEDDSVIEDCTDEDEAQKIADHYREIIASLEQQKTKKLRSYSQAEAESISAITAEFFRERDKAEKFYDKHCDALSGMVGVWEYLRNAALIFEAEAVGFGVAGDDYDWMVAVQEFASMLYVRMNDNKLRIAARKCLTANQFKGAK